MSGRPQRTSVMRSREKQLEREKEQNRLFRKFENAETEFQINVTKKIHRNYAYQQYKNVIIKRGQTPVNSPNTLFSLAKFPRVDITLNATYQANPKFNEKTTVTLTQFAKTLGLLSEEAKELKRSLKSFRVTSKSSIISWMIYDTTTKSLFVQPPEISNPHTEVNRYVVKTTGHASSEWSTAFYPLGFAVPLVRLNKTVGKKNGIPRELVGPLSKFQAGIKYQGFFVNDEETGGPIISGVNHGSGAVRRLIVGRLRGPSVDELSDIIFGAISKNSDEQKIDALSLKLNGDRLSADTAGMVTNSPNLKFIKPYSEELAKLIAEYDFNVSSNRVGARIANNFNKMTNRDIFNNAILATTDQPLMLYAFLQGVPFMFETKGYLYIYKPPTTTILRNLKDAITSYTEFGKVSQLNKLPVKEHYDNAKEILNIILNEPDANKRLNYHAMLDAFHDFGKADRGINLANVVSKYVTGSTRTYNKNKINLIENENVFSHLTNIMNGTNVVKGRENTMYLRKLFKKMYGPPLFKEEELDYYLNLFNNVNQIKAIETLIKTSFIKILNTGTTKIELSTVGDDIIDKFNTFVGEDWCIVNDNFSFDGIFYNLLERTATHIQRISDGWPAGETVETFQDVQNRIRKPEMRLKNIRKKAKSIAKKKIR